MTIRTKVVNSPTQKEEFAQTALHAVVIGIMSNLATFYLEKDCYSEATSFFSNRFKSHLPQVI